MCGIAGLIRPGRNPGEARKTVERMLDSIRHRGPDGQGTAQGDGWVIGHVRLAIVDVEGGRQPIWSVDQRQVVIGNNEIYNAPELRQELEALGHRFSTRSDTEVFLHGWKQWGTGLFERLNGMFAVSIIDLDRRLCVLARDAMGIKPLHFVRIGDGIAFASEIKALLEVPGVSRGMNRDALHLFMNLRYLPGDQTLFEGVERVPPGSYLIQEFEVPAAALRSERFFHWSSIPRHDSLSFSSASEELRQVLDRSVRRHLISDVEVGAYLSGGVDSSVVTALASRSLPGIRTFCMGFGEPTDENADAREVAGLFKARHTDLSVDRSPGQARVGALHRFSEVLWNVEEPKINCLQGFLLAETVSKQVKVALSGLGGDELFAGYVNHDLLYPMTVLKRFFSPSLGAHSLSGLQSLLGGVSSDFYFRIGELAENLTDPLQYYAILRNSFDHNPYLLRSIYQSPPEHWHGMTAEALKPYFDSRNPDTFNELLKLEARTKLPGDFLLTEDRVSMAHALEVRVPLLDLELVRFAFGLPSSFKYLPGKKKRILKNAATAWLPEQVLAKKKWGFSFNPYLLFEKELRPFARKVLTRERVEELGVFSWKWIQEVMEARPSPRLRWHYFNLWVMTGVVIWHDLFFGGRQLERE